MTAGREPRSEVLALFRDGLLAGTSPPASPAPPRCDAALVRYVGDDADLDVADERDDDEGPEPEPPPPVARIGLLTVVLEIADLVITEWLASRRDRRETRRELPCSKRST